MWNWIDFAQYIRNVCKSGKGKSKEQWRRNPFVKGQLGLPKFRQKNPQKPNYVILNLTKNGSHCIRVCRISKESNSIHWFCCNTHSMDYKCPIKPNASRKPKWLGTKSFSQSQLKILGSDTALSIHVLSIRTKS